MIEDARSGTARAINAEIVLAYWHIGREIAQEEQSNLRSIPFGSFIHVIQSVTHCVTKGK